MLLRLEIGGTEVDAALLHAAGPAQVEEIEPVRQETRQLVAGLLPLDRTSARVRHSPTSCRFLGMSARLPTPHVPETTPALACGFLNVVVLERGE